MMCRKAHLAPGVMSHKAHLAYVPFKYTLFLMKSINNQSYQIDYWVISREV